MGGSDLPVLSRLPEGGQSEVSQAHALGSISPAVVLWRSPVNECAAVDGARSSPQASRRVSTAHYASQVSCAATRLQRPANLKWSRRRSRISVTHGTWRHCQPFCRRKARENPGLVSNASSLACALPVPNDDAIAPGTDPILNHDTRRGAVVEMVTNNNVVARNRC